MGATEGVSSDSEHLAVGLVLGEGGDVGSAGGIGWCKMQMRRR